MEIIMEKLNSFEKKKLKDPPKVKKKFKEEKSSFRPQLTNKIHNIERDQNSQRKEC